MAWYENRQCDFTLLTKFEGRIFKGAAVDGPVVLEFADVLDSMGTHSESSDFQSFKRVPLTTVTQRHRTTHPLTSWLGTATWRHVRCVASAHDSSNGESCSAQGENLRLNAYIHLINPTAVPFQRSSTISPDSAP